MTSNAAANIDHSRKGSTNPGSPEAHTRPLMTRSVPFGWTRRQAPLLRSSSAKARRFLGGTPKPVQRRDEEGVTLHKGVECSIELGREARAPDTPWST